MSLQFIEPMCRRLSDLILRVRVRQIEVSGRRGSTMLDMMSEEKVEEENLF